MRVGAFEVDDSLAGLRDAAVISTLRPWVDAGSVATLTFASMQQRLGAHTAGALARPGDFFDLTRYRPTVRYSGEERVFTVPNTRVSVARGMAASDLVFIDVLEPHARAEDYIDAIVELVAFVGAKTFCRIGAWYSTVPHTREPRVSHSRAGVQVDPRTGRELPRTGRYEGPTSIMNVLNDRLSDLGIESTTLMIQLPHYAQVEENYAGAAAMIEAVGETFGLTSEVSEWTAGYRARGERQREQIDRMVARDLELSATVRQLESEYDAQYAATEEPSALSAEIERFLGEVLGTIEKDDDET